MRLTELVLKSVIKIDPPVVKYTTLNQSKVRFTPEQAMKAQRGTRGTAILIL